MLIKLTREQLDADEAEAFRCLLSRRPEWRETPEALELARHIFGIGFMSGLEWSMRRIELLREEAKGTP